MHRSLLASPPTPLGRYNIMHRLFSMRSAPPPRLQQLVLSSCACVRVCMQWGGARCGVALRAYLSELGCLPVSATFQVQFIYA
jgi:hypothetical protein|eukprot:COSAG01_NODE_6385_length_3702_cov_3.140716_3_plen_83_part_00